MDGTSRKPWEEVENDEYSLSVMIFYFLFSPFPRKMSVGFLDASSLIDLITTSSLLLLLDSCCITMAGKGKRRDTCQCILMEIHGDRP